MLHRLCAIVHLHCNALQCIIVVNSTSLNHCSAVQCSAVQFTTIHCIASLHYIALHYTALSSTASLDLIVVQCSHLTSLSDPQGHPSPQKFRLSTFRIDLPEGRDLVEYITCLKEEEIK